MKQSNAAETKSKQNEGIGTSEYPSRKWNNYEKTFKAIMISRFIS